LLIFPSWSMSLTSNIYAACVLSSSLTLTRKKERKKVLY
jgi:hypothetical protein